MSQSSSNHSKAPISAAFVKEMREVFGDVQVIYVKEGDLQLGAQSEGWNPIYREVKRDASADRGSIGRGRPRTGLRVREDHGQLTAGVSPNVERSGG